MNPTKYINELAADLAHNPRSIDYIVDRLVNLWDMAKLQGQAEIINRIELSVIGSHITEPEQVDPFTKLNPEE